jgi:hypothetical protein
MQLCLLFDCDETLFVIRPDSKMHKVSFAAMSTMVPLKPVKPGKEDRPPKLDFYKENVLMNGNVGVDDGSEIPDERIETMVFIAKNHYYDLFKTIKEANKEKLNVLVGFVTASRYSKTCIIKLLNEIYPDTIFDNPDNVEFYNTKDLWNDAVATATIGRDKIMVDAPSGNKANLVKANLIEKCYPIWSEKLGSLERKRVVLTDDDREMAEGVEMAGFTGKVIPTNIKETVDFQSECVKLFDSLQSLVKEAF